MKTTTQYLSLSSPPPSQGGMLEGKKLFEKKEVFTGTINLNESVNRRFLHMRKTIFLKRGLKNILVVWFFFCILPGDCFLLGCEEKDLLYRAEEESVTFSHNDADSSVPQDHLHCQNCCVLCAHNLVMSLLQSSSLVLFSSSSWFKTLHFNHPKSILQTIIYHPPRLAA